MGFSIWETVILVVGLVSMVWAWWMDRGAKIRERFVNHMLAEAVADKAERFAAERREVTALQTAERLLHPKPRPYTTHYRHFSELWLDVAVGDEVQVFKCAGCDEVKWRGESGYLKVCDGVEFCSTECRKDPRPFDHTQVGGYLSMN